MSTVDHPQIEHVPMSPLAKVNGQAALYFAHSREEIEAILRQYPAKPLFHFPERYDISYPGYIGDAQYYTRRCLGHTLYTGVGTGRIFNAIENECDVVGMDNSSQMIGLLTRNKPSSARKVKLGDVLDESTFRQGEFDSVIAPHSFLTLFNKQEIQEILSNIRFWLKRNGSFTTDIFSPFKNPDFETDFEVTTKPSPDGNRDVPTVLTYDYINQCLMERTVISCPRPLVLEMKLNYFYPAEFKRILEDNRFAVSRILGSFNGEDPPTTKSDVFVYESSKR